MKKQLFLLLVALSSVIALNARSVSSPRPAVDPSSVDLNIVSQPSFEIVGFSNTAPALTVQTADSDTTETETPYTPLPIYNVSGLFYDGIIADGDYAEYFYPWRFAYLPPFSKLAYLNKSYYLGTPSGSYSWEWSVPQVYNVDLSARTFYCKDNTATTMNYTADFETPYFPYAVSYSPSLTMDSVTYKVGATSSGYEMYMTQWGGRRTNAYSDADDEHFYLTYYPANSKVDDLSTLETDYDIFQTFLTSYNLGAQIYTDIEDHLAVASYLLPSNYRTYGISKVVLRTAIYNVAAGGKFKVDIYKCTYNTKVNYVSELYQVGERVAGGYVSTDDYAEYSYKYKAIEIPIIDVEGEGDEAIESESFYNVTEPVIVVVSLESAPDATDKVFPMWVIAKGESTSRMYQFACGGNFFTHFPQYDSSGTATGDTFASFYPTFWKATTLKNDSGSYSVYQLGYDMQFDLRYSYLFNDGSHPELSATLPAEGGSQSFDFTPSDDLYNAKFSTSDGSSWAYAYPDGDYVEYGTQKLVVEADALPSDVKGRATTITVEIQGDVITIPVTQGDTSGLENIAADAPNVVSTQIFDLQGRRLNAVPESGLYIRRDVNADNTVTTTKLSK